ncbi:hypothetical protein EJ02DRAFT_467797 [Clathrospora elynae]|uniref:Uncharacterized protein n=1 Tax=Clathrospora elynae TaxID=706981 RepID=A0A6A5SS60_9PLEO|nr:hypothetical protein EJ02DRAFT_467797 [Clathrospora elynae]
MADHANLIILDPPEDDTTCSTDTPPVVKLFRQDTASTTGSTNRLPNGHWALNLSGNCSNCHRHHRSLQVHVRVSDDSTHVGDVYCTKCRRLWLAFGRLNTTRLSLLSTLSIEPEPQETVFRATLVHMIRYATPIAALSPTLTAIPEATSGGPSRETSVRSTIRSIIPGTSSTIHSKSAPATEEVASRLSHVQGTITTARPVAQGHTTLNKHNAARITQLLLRAKEKFDSKFPKLQSRLSRWLPQKTMSPDKEEPQPNREPLPSTSRVLHSPLLVSKACEEGTQSQHYIDTGLQRDKLDVCSPSTSAAEALDLLRALDSQTLQVLSPEQRTRWGREQLTSFKSRYAKSNLPVVAPTMVDNETQANLPDVLLLPYVPPLRRYSALAFIGSGFGTSDNWGVFRGSHSTLGRSLSMSETHLSDADTAVEGMSVPLAPRHILIESLQRNRRGSGSPRPLSIHSVVQDWQQVYQNRAEARRSADSTATGGAVWTTTAARGRVPNRLSRASMGPIYGTEPSMSQIQLPLSTNEESEDISAQEQPPSPPTPEEDVRPPGELPDSAL